MKSIIRVICIIAIIVSAAFILNDKMKLHIGFLEIKTMTMLWVFAGAVVVSIIGLALTRDI